MDNKKYSEIDNRLVNLYSKPKVELKTIVENTHRVVDLRGADKHILVSMILEAEFGHKTMEKFEEFEGEE